MSSTSIMASSVRSESEPGSDIGAWKSESSEPVDLPLDFFLGLDFSLFLSFVGVSPRCMLCYNSYNS